MSRWSSGRLPSQAFLVRAEGHRWPTLHRTTAPLARAHELAEALSDSRMMGIMVSGWVVDSCLRMPQETRAEESTSRPRAPPRSRSENASALARRLR